MSELPDAPRSVTSPWVPVVLFLVSVGFVAWSQEYGEVARLLPTVMGTATAILCLLDLASRFDWGVGRAIRIAMGADFRAREMTHTPAPRAELVQALWMVACVALMMTIGILPTIPLFVALYMRLHGGRPWVQSVLSGLAVLVFVVVVFEVVLDYPLYRGVLFDPRGFEAW